MKNKKGWMRILEATIAVLIVVVVMVTIYLNQASEEVVLEDPLQEIQSWILKEISVNEGLRGFVLEDNLTAIEDYVGEKLPSSYNHSILICDLVEACDLGFEIVGDLYIQEVLIFANQTKYNPRRVKLFVWEK